MERKKIEQNLIFTPSILELKNERRRKKENSRKEYKQSQVINKNKKNILIKIFHSSILKKKERKSQRTREDIHCRCPPFEKEDIEIYIYILGKNLFKRYSLVESGESSKTFLPWASYFAGVIWRNLSFFLLTGRGINIYIKRDRKKWRGKEEARCWILEKKEGELRFE